MSFVFRRIEKIWQDLLQNVIIHFFSGWLEKFSLASGVRHQRRTPASNPSWSASVRRALLGLKFGWLPPGVNSPQWPTLKLGPKHFVCNSFSFALLLGWPLVYPIELQDMEIDFSGTEFTTPVVNALFDVHNMNFGVAAEKIKQYQDE